MDISAVERIYAQSWLIGAVMDSTPTVLALTSESALGYFHFPDYPRPAEADFAVPHSSEGGTLEEQLRIGSGRAAASGGPGFRLVELTDSRALFEYTGPLGRRSAAQPRLVLRFLRGESVLAPVHGQLIHLFSDRPPGLASAVSLDELAGRYLALYCLKPRARDVFDLWFILTHSEGQFDVKSAASVARQQVAARGKSFKLELDPSHRPWVEKAWENALKNVVRHPSFEQAEAEILLKVGDFA